MGIRAVFGWLFRTKQVKWELDGLDFQSPGSFRIRGTVQNEQYQFPLACGFGDPVISHGKAVIILLPPTTT